MTGSFKDFLNANGVDMTVNGKCSCCGSCCGRILPLTHTDKLQIRKYIKKYHITACRVPEKNLVDMNCPFLDMSKPIKKCKIYEVRPEICKEFVCCNFNKERNPVREGYEIVDMRHEFFGDEDMWKQALGSVILGNDKEKQ